MSQAGRALLHAFETGALALKRAFFLRAVPLPLKDIDSEQSFRPDFLKLKGATPRLESGAYPLGLVLLTKHKEENFANIARGWALLEPGGRLVCAGANDDGAASLEKQVAKALGRDDTLSKYHSRVFWLTKTDKAPPDYWINLAAPQPVANGAFVSQPGLFSWDRIDDGSALLAQHLPADLAGRVADFGCGWGYLGREVLKSARVEALDLIDAEHRAIEVARLNVTDRRAAFHWLDLASEKPPATYDVIVCNPPFHTGRAMQPELGQKVIEAAANALKPGGRLYMVANRGLPYEATLKQRFSTVELLADNNKFRVSRAER